MDSLSAVEVAPQLRIAIEIHNILRLVASCVIEHRISFGQVMHMHTPLPPPKEIRPLCNTSNTMLLLFHLFKSDKVPMRVYIHSFISFISQLDGHNVLLHKALWQEREPCPLG